MQLKKLCVLAGVLFVCSAVSYAQRVTMLEQGVEAAVSRQAARRSLPTLRDGLRNRWSGRLGPAVVLQSSQRLNRVAPVLNYRAGKLAPVTALEPVVAEYYLETLSKPDIYPYPGQVIHKTLLYMDAGGRVPGSSPTEAMSPEETALLAQLNWVEKLRQLDLLKNWIPMQREREALELRLNDIVQAGYIYQQISRYIPEYANDGQTLNIPSRSPSGWEAALSKWKATHGNDVTPRSAITGNFELPINFNDLTAEEQEEVLLGTYLKIAGK